MAHPMVEEMVRAILSPEAHVRERGADEVTDVHRGFAEEDATELARALVDARCRETVTACQEAQLNALCDLNAWHRLDRDLLRPLSCLRAESLPLAQAEYLAELLKTSE